MMYDVNETPCTYIEGVCTGWLVTRNFGLRIKVVQVNTLLVYIDDRQDALITFHVDADKAYLATFAQAI
jgi:hypothetical protein